MGSERPIRPAPQPDAQRRRQAGASSGKPVHRPHRPSEAGAAARPRPAADRSRQRQHTDAARPVRPRSPQPQKQGTHTVSAAKQPAKRRNMTLKEKLIIAASFIGAIILCTVMVLNMKILPYTAKDSFGREYSTRISLMQKLRNWQPFLEIDGELESKEYDMTPKAEGDHGDDGLDLDQIIEGQFTVLFLGTDESRSNTDVIMLALFDIRGNYIHILQIPRDTFVPAFTSFEAGKINSVYTLGNQEKQPIQRVVDCLETSFRIPIDRYITTSCSDIAEIVDLVGGVPIDMPYKITYEADKIIEKGEQVLNGQQAEWMVRFRHDYTEGDIGRMKAQRIFMAAAMAKASDIGSIEMLGYINTIVDKKLIGSNLTVDEMSKLADFASSIGMERISMHMLPGEGYNYYPPNPQTNIKFYSVWAMHKQAIIDLLNTYFRPYFEPEYTLPIIEPLSPDQYQSTMYDDDSTNFQRIEDGDTFMGT